MKGLSLTIFPWLLLFASTAFAQQLVADGKSITFDAVKEHIISALVADWDSYSICEHVDRSNKHSYVGKLLPASELSVPEKAITARYFEVRRHAESTGIDFSFYKIQFASDMAATHALGLIRNGRTGTVADGHILTRYAAQVNGNELYIIRSQSLLDPAVRSLLESFAGTGNPIDK